MAARPCAAAHLPRAPRSRRMTQPSPPPAPQPLAATPPRSGGFGAPLLSWAATCLRLPGGAGGAGGAGGVGVAAAASSSPAPTAAAPRHLFFLVHGLAGQPEDLSCLREQLLARSGGAAAVHLARANVVRGASTHDGVDVGAARVAAELRAVVAARPSLTHVSLVGNSLGGLYCRYAAALSYDPAARTVAGLRPVTFLTTATPHLGVGTHGYLGLIPPFLQASLGARAFGRSVAQMLLQDNGDHPSGVPLLERMAAPPAAGGPPDPPFVAALAAFQRRVAYANRANDFLVAYETAAILASAAEDAAAPPLPLLGPLGGPPRVLYTRERPPVPLQQSSPAGSAPAPRGDRLARQRRMAAGLGSLGWTETAVLFPGALPNAHNKIVALRRDPILTWMYADGAAVVAHTADALLADLVPPEEVDAAGGEAARETAAARTA